ncbi:OLC1v1028973C1 [Oldenlandia corymbosa var. corymbosa]|uniref:OLC1v1028973C1 n=1 Tax=Oldenlandia corymbosa var. corymbosa TaxID=529605 RepID=A0AAV1CDT1_OLDCO|nr:OLC1v1028973C1 [Oldenlandia corymbosa var. corymbosa]
MEFLRFLLFFTILSLAIVASQADLDDYWKSKLPNTRMPKAVRDLLHNDWSEDKSTSVGVGKGGVNVNTGKGKGTHVNVGKGGVNVNTGKGKGTHVSVGKKGGVGVSTGKGTRVGVGKGGVGVSTGHKGHRVYVGVTPSPDPFKYLYAASEAQLHDDPNVALFFLEKDLHKGTTMNLKFTEPQSSPAGFLPRKTADSIPFSSNGVDDVLTRFDLKPDSASAEALKNTIKECEEPGIDGEEKYCATSMESMVDFTTSKLGSKVEAISTEVQKPDTESSQKYQIVDVRKLNGIKDDKSVVCHKMKYAYAVFYCHKTLETEAYAVSLIGANGNRAKAVAVCHKDTAAWNPKHLAFQVLKVKPGTVPICHFLPQDHIVWVSA